MKMVGGKIKISKFEQEVNKVMRTTPEYVQLIKQMEEVQAKQVVLHEKYVEIAEQIQKVDNQYSDLYDKRFEMQYELKKEISDELMQDPEMAKLVDVYEE